MAPHDPILAGLMRDAVAQLRAGQFAGAERLLRQALTRQESNPDVQYALGVAVARQLRSAPSTLSSRSGT